MSGQILDPYDVPLSAINKSNRKYINKHNKKCYFTSLVLF